MHIGLVAVARFSSSLTALATPDRPRILLPRRPSSAAGTYPPPTFPAFTEIGLCPISRLHSLSGAFFLGTPQNKTGPQAGRLKRRINKMSAIQQVAAHACVKTGNLLGIAVEQQRIHPLPGMQDTL